MLRALFLFSLLLSYCNSSYYILKCKEAMWAQGNSTKHAMHQYLAVMCGRAREATKRFASVSLHHCKKQTKIISAECQRDFLFSLFNLYLSSLLKIFRFTS